MSPEERQVLVELFQRTNAAASQPRDKDAEAFIQNPSNFEEALQIAQSFFKFEFPRGDEVMRKALEIALPAYKASLNRASLKAIGDYLLTTKQIDAPIDVDRLVWDKAPAP